MVTFKSFAAAAMIGVAATAFSIVEATAQGARSSLNDSQSGSLRNSYASGGRGSSSASGQASPINQRRGAGVGGLPDANGASGQGGVDQGPMAAGLAESVGERFQEDGFVGRDADDVRASFESQSGRRGPGGMFDAMIENLNELRDSQRRWRQQNAPPPPIRVQLRPAFAVPSTATVRTGSVVQARLTKEIGKLGIDSAQAEVTGRTVVLRGVVPTERDRQLLARLALLEPGVSAVENLVTIQPPPAQ